MYKKKAAARFIMDNPRILMVSIIAFVVSCLFFAYWFLVAVYLYSSGGIKDEVI